MAPNRWVVNASPLILLGKIDQIALLGAMAEEIVVPICASNDSGHSRHGS